MEQTLLSLVHLCGFNGAFCQWSCPCNLTGVYIYPVEPKTCLFVCCRCVIAPCSRGNEWFISQSCRLTQLSGTLEERCIIHIVDWSLFCTSGVHREKVESTLRCARSNSFAFFFVSFLQFLIVVFKSEYLLPVNELITHLSSSQRQIWGRKKVTISHSDMHSKTHKKTAFSQTASWERHSRPVFLLFGCLLLPKYSDQDHSSPDLAFYSWELH